MRGRRIAAFSPISGGNQVRQRREHPVQCDKPFHHHVNVPVKRDSVQKGMNVTGSSTVFGMELHKLPVELVISWIPVKDICLRLTRVSKKWNQCLEQAAIWKQIFGRITGIPCRDSFSANWKRSCQRYAAPRAYSSLLSLKPHSQVIFDLHWALIPPKFACIAENDLFFLTGRDIEFSLELLPGFFWIVVKTRVGRIHTGVIVHDGRIVHDKGLAPAREFLSRLNVEDLQHIQPKALVLLLTTFEALPPSVDVDEVLSRQIDLEWKPFSLTLHCRREAEGLFRASSHRNGLRQAEIRHLAQQAHASLSISKFQDENRPPEGYPSVAQLTLVRNELRWKVTFKNGFVLNWSQNEL